MNRPSPWLFAFGALGVTGFGFVVAQYPGVANKRWLWLGISTIWAAMMWLDLRGGKAPFAKGQEIYRDSSPKLFWFYAVASTTMLAMFLWVAIFDPRLGS